MAVICPTVTANDAHQYREQVEQVALFAERIHLDFMDGLFVKAHSPKVKQAWWPHSIPADLHLMYERPDLYLDDVLELKPQLVIIHAEAEGSFTDFAKSLRRAGIKVGVAILQKTEPELLKPALEYIDHVLIFSGDLGHFGGHVDFKLLDKVKTLKRLKGGLEIGWDGGINDKNAEALINGGVDVLNVGGFIHNADDPQGAYAKLQAIVSGGKT